MTILYENCQLSKEDWQHEANHRCPFGESSKSKPKQDPPIEHDVMLSLEEVLKGATKKMKITKRVIMSDGITTKREDKTLTINIEPGCIAGTRITFPREGDQNANSIPADIIFIIRDKPHPLFIRDGSDIKYNVEVNLLEAITCNAVFEVPTLTGDVIRIGIKELIDSKIVKTIPGQGLPFTKNASGFGNLRVVFDIELPFKPK